MTKTASKYNRIRICIYVITLLLFTRLARYTTKYMQFDLIRLSRHQVYSWIDVSSSRNVPSHWINNKGPIRRPIRIYTCHWTQTGQYCTFVLPLSSYCWSLEWRLGDLYVSYCYYIEIVSYIELDLLWLRNNNNGKHQEQRDDNGQWQRFRLRVRSQAKPTLEVFGTLRTPCSMLRSEMQLSMFYYYYILKEGKTWTT